jgi:hypothetical protein
VTLLGQVAFIHHIALQLISHNTRHMKNFASSCCWQLMKAEKGSALREERNLCTFCILSLTITRISHLTPVLRVSCLSRDQ